MAKTRDTFTTAQAARLLGVSVATVVYWIDDGRLKAHKTPGGHRRIAREDLISFAHHYEMPLGDDELAFYDALAQNESAVDAMGIDELKVIAGELVTNVRRSVSIDWAVRESARAKIRVIVRRILKRFGYPPDLREEAVKLVLEQAETLCEEWAV